MDNTVELFISAMKTRMKTTVSLTECCESHWMHKKNEVNWGMYTSNGNPKL